MMLLKIKNLKYTIKNVSACAVFFILAFAPVNSQEIIEENTNDNFIEKAPKNVIEKFKKQEEEIKNSIEKIDQIINTIK